MTKRRKGEQRQGRCVYCGEDGPITDDHVFPRVIFLVKDKQMVSVPACTPCQEIKKPGDEDLRNYITLDIGGSQHPDAFTHLEKMMSGNPRRRAWLGRVISEAEEVELFSDAGLLLGGAIQFPFDSARIVVSQEMTIKGLHFYETGNALPPGYPVDIQHVPWEHALQFVQSLSAKVRIAPTVKGRDVAWWQSFALDGLPVQTRAWLVCYNDWVLFVGTTGEAAIRAKENRAAAAQRKESRHLLHELLTLPSPSRLIVPRDPSGRPILPPQ